ncbi:hypothetical protein CUZ99_2130 [Enterococcus faecium]|nr:hypothetical protein HMPREF1347_02144 [Enterococcus faecium 504]MBK4830432.1 hypothetical protein [Enterococcus faecium]MBK4843233.1 hypothetical protein [Enterococcus faecium]
MSLTFSSESQETNSKNSFSYLLNSVTRDSELTRATRSDFEE